jgi:hypothetical protein
LQDVNSLQYEAEQLATKAATEKAEVLGELDRLHKLVASFQAQIREVRCQLISAAHVGLLWCPGLLLFRTVLKTLHTVCVSLLHWQPAA